MEFIKENFLDVIKTNLFILGGMIVINFAWTEAIDNPVFFSDASRVNFGFPVVFFIHVIVALFISNLPVFNHQHSNYGTLGFWILTFVVFLTNPIMLSLLATAGFLFRMSYHICLLYTSDAADE